MPELVVMQQGQTTVRAPKGWQLKVDEAQGGLVIQESEKPDSPSIVRITGPYSAATNPDALIQRASSQLKSARLLSNAPLGASGRVVVLEGLSENIPAKVAIAAWADPLSGTSNLVIFAAPKARFDRLGGVQLLFAIFGQGQPAPQAQQSPPKNMTPFEEASRLLQQKRAAPKGKLTGSWSYGLSVPTGTDLQNVVTGEISYGSTGSGTYLRFSNNGRYTMLYNYSGTFGLCKNTVSASEEGRFDFDGRVVTLTPKKSRTELCSCGCKKPSIQKNKALGRRTLEVSFSGDFKRIGGRGKCPKYMISCPQSGRFTHLYQRAAR